MSEPRKSIVHTLLMAENRRRDLLRALLAELIGTAVLVLFTCGTCVSSGKSHDSLVVTALSFGLTVTCLAATIGHVSGCHINPGVTIGLLANGQISLVRAVLYVAAQLVGGTAGAAVLAGVLSTGNQNLCATKLNGDTTPVQGVVIEAFIVFLLVFVVCNVVESNSHLAPLTIGLAVTAGHLFAIPLTSSSMNSARSFGPAIIQNYWTNHYVYWIGPLLGGTLGGLAHRFLFPNETLDKCDKVSAELTGVNTTTI